MADRSQLIDAKPTTPITFGLAGSGTLLSDMKGDIPVGNTQIRDVYHVPGVGVPIVSVRNLENQGWKVDFAKDVIEISGATFPICNNGLPMVRTQDGSCHTSPPWLKRLRGLTHRFSPSSWSTAGSDTCP